MPHQHTPLPIHKQSTNISLAVINERSIVGKGIPEAATKNKDTIQKNFAALYYFKMKLKAVEQERARHKKREKIKIGRILAAHYSFCATIAMKA